MKCSPGIVMIVNSDFSKFGPCFFYIHYITVSNEDRLIARAEVWTQTPTQEPTLQGTGSFPPPLMMTQAQIGESVASIRPGVSISENCPMQPCSNDRILIVDIKSTECSIYLCNQAKARHPSFPHQRLGADTCSFCRD